MGYNRFADKHTPDKKRGLKHSILQFSVHPFDDTLSTDALLNIIGRSKGCRDRIFTPLVTLQTFIFQALSADGSCRQAVSHVFSGRLHQGFSANSIKTGAYCRARQRLPVCNSIIRY